MLLRTLQFLSESVMTEFSTSNTEDDMPSITYTIEMDHKTTAFWLKISPCSDKVSSQSSLPSPLTESSAILFPPSAISQR